MKRLFLLILFILLTISHYAQNFSLGANLGVTFSSYYNYKDSFNNNFKPGFIAGISGQIKAVDKFYILTELKYEQRGTRNKFERLIPIAQPSQYMDLKVISKYNYITLSILAKPHFGKKEIFYLSIGPFIGYLLDAWREEIYTDHSSGEILAIEKSEISHSNDNKNLNTVDCGLATNTGLSFNIFRKTKLFFEFNYFMSFISINKLTSPKHFGFGINTGVLIEI